MEKLTRREEELMQCFWTHGPLFVRELVALAPEPKPHFNTYQYYPLVSEREFSRRTLGSVIDRYFEKSCLGAVSALVEEERLSVEELRELIERIERQNIR